MRSGLLAAGIVAGILMSAASAMAAAPDEATMAKIAPAAPDKAAVAPTKPRKLLVFNLTRSYRHDSIPVAAAAIQLMGQRTGAYETTVSEDISLFEPANLSQFDAVCLNSTTGELFALPDADQLSDEQKQEAARRQQRLQQSLLNFVASGKGLVGIHGATDCFYQWPEYGKLIGAYFKEHPWQKVVVKLDEPGHPLNAALGGQGFEVADEIYTFREPYSRQNLRVLLSVDWGKSNLPNGNRADNDYALAWVRQHGQGRVFYSAFGHRNEIFQDPKLMRFMLDGIQFALGDLKADAAPSAQPAATPATQSDGWRDLFNGQNLDGWHHKPNGWKIENRTLVWQKDCGDLWTRERFGDFVLDLEFLLAKGTNSGVFVRCDSIPNWLHTAIEVQVLDSHGKHKPDKHDCGAVYDCLAPSASAVKPAGEWNRMTVTCQGPRIQVVLNDQPIIDMGLDQWTEAHKNPDGTPNKFNIAYRDMKREGHIGLQDHGGAVSYRNIRIKPLAAADGAATTRPTLVSRHGADEKLGWRLGLQAWTFNRLSFEETVDRAASVGLRYVEAYPGQLLFRGRRDRFDQSMSPALQAEVKKTLEAAQVRLVNYGVVGTSNNETECRRLFEFAKAMGIHTIVSEPPEEAIPMLDRLCNEYGINLAIHNHPKPSHYWNPDTVLKVCQGASQRIGACADTGHWMRSGLDPVESLKKLEGRIISLHFKDLSELSAGAHDVPWGTGKGNASAMLQELRRQQFQGVFSIEYEHNTPQLLSNVGQCVEFFDRTAQSLGQDADRR